MRHSALLVKFILVGAVRLVGRREKLDDEKKRRREELKGEKKVWGKDGTACTQVGQTDNLVVVRRKCIKGGFKWIIRTRKKPRKSLAPLAAVFEPADPPAASKMPLFSIDSPVLLALVYIHTYTEAATASDLLLYLLSWESRNIYSFEPLRKCWTFRLILTANFYTWSHMLAKEFFC